MFAGAEQYGYSWSVHRPHTIIGYALGNAMNMGQTLAVYATLCREKAGRLSFPARRSSGTVWPMSPKPVYWRNSCCGRPVLKGLPIRISTR